MIIRKIETTEADRRSARVFFEALASYWNIANCRALEMFARNGQLTLENYAGYPREIDVWELMPEHEQALYRFPRTRIRIGCSYEAIEQAPEGMDYDLIVVDSPQGLHSDKKSRTHVEHFSVVHMLPKLVGRQAIVVLYVNKRPYDKNKLGEHGYDSYENYDFSEWMRARANFYCTATPSLITEEDALKAYRRVFAGGGLFVRNTLTVPCYSDVPGREPYAFRLALELSR